MGYAVQIEGQQHGEVFKLSGRWRWFRPGNRGIETYNRKGRLLAVRQHIARLNKIRVADVRLVKQ